MGEFLFSIAEFLCVFSNCLGTYLPQSQGGVKKAISNEVNHPKNGTGSKNCVLPGGIGVKSARSIGLLLATASQTSISPPRRSAQSV